MEDRRMADFPMTSRERVMMALSHREPDRVPYDIGGVGPSGFSIGAYENLLKHVKWDEKAEIGDVSFQRAKLSEAFLREFQVDTRALIARAQESWKLNIQTEGDFFFFFDEWGVGSKMPRVNGLNYFIYHHPLAAVETDHLARYPWPDPNDPRRLEGLVEEARSQREKSNPALVFGGAFSLGLLQFGATLEGMDRFFMNFFLDPYRVEWVLDKLLELKMSFYLWALEKLRGWIDVVFMGDDFGHQQSQWISPDMFRKFIKPRYAELLRTIKKRFEVKVLLHSDGAIYPFLPDIIEMGFDVLNPIQLGAKGMGDTGKMKREFGDGLCFWGGGIDVQQFLPTATPRMIEEEVKRRIEDLAPGGGFVFTTTQTIQPDIPPENFIAMWKAVQRYGRYPLEQKSGK
jgi:uroporphyrinogen decarboxylase